MMALQLSVTPSSSIRSHNSVPRSLLPTCTSFRGDDWSILSKNVDFLDANLQGSSSSSCISRSSRAAAAVAVVKCSSSSSSSSLDTAAVVKVGQVTEVDKDTFWPIVHGAGDKTVVLDMYTQWCGPCKIIAPKYQELSEKYLDVVFLKLDCNQENKPLAKELGIKVVPTFKILKEGSIVKEVTGAKFDDLVVAIETVRSS